MHLLHNAPLSKAELAAALGRKSVTGALNRVVRSLLEGGLIEYTLPHKPNSRLQKYRLTPGGAARLSMR
ncbi:Fic family protein [Desulfonatronum sp. SC1]|uniref:Fic family protein n=1 Tax=Desulfonatronum sp. SC1 TaxID=2109626 RepID=UPI0018EE5C12|nr:cell filamentation protein Fic [Desulfonatronum sp. SC1]